jgi:hypothetical protein
MSTTWVSPAGRPCSFLALADIGFACQASGSFLALADIGFACQASGSFLALAFGDVTVGRAA